MDKSKPGYRTYFVKNDQTNCNVNTSLKPIEKLRFDFTVQGNEIRLFGNTSIAEVRDASGSLMASFSNVAKTQSYKASKSGIYFFTLMNEQNTTVQKVAIF